MSASRLPSLGRPAREERLTLGKTRNDEVRILERGHRHGRDLPPVTQTLRWFPATVAESTIRLVALVLEAKHATREFVEAVLSLLVVIDLGHFTPGLLRRLDRCSDEDQKELLALVEFLSKALVAASDPAIDNTILGNHVLRTDLMAKLSTFPLDDMLAAREPLVFWSGAASSEALDAVVEGWPVNYPPASTALEGVATPIVMLNGGLDIQTPSPWARKLAKQLGAPLVEFPYVGHGVDVSLASPLTGGDPSCSLGILRSFIDDPTGAIDGSCAKTAYTPDVGGHGEVAKRVAAKLYGHETPLLGSEPDEPSAKHLRSASVTDLEPIERSLRERLANAFREMRMRVR